MVKLFLKTKNSKEKDWGGKWGGEVWDSGRNARSGKKKGEEGAGRRAKQGTVRGQEWEQGAGKCGLRVIKGSFLSFHSI